MTYFSQSAYATRCEWGLPGVQLLAPISDAIIIVDVISFTTCVSLALEQGATVYPYAWKDDRSRAYAESLGAVLAAGNRKDPTAISLAPSSMQRLAAGTKIVLPSPNGATLSLATGETPTFAGCLRNAKAVATAAAKLGSRISVIPAGERWPGEQGAAQAGPLRPSLEDQIGAGAIIHHLPGPHSPEALAAEAVYLRFRDDLSAALLACSSGLESADRGSPLDVTLAAELNAATTVPRLVNNAYISS